MNSTYFDDLDIENYFEASNPTKIPTEAGLVQTKPQGIDISTAPRMNADGKLKDKLKAFVKSKAGKTLLKISALGGGVAVAIAFGPELIALIAPLLPAMKTALANKGIKAKGLGNIIKKFHETQIGALPEDASSGQKAKQMVQGILGFFKKTKEKRANGTASPLENLLLKTADETIQKIGDGTLSVEEVTSDEANDTAKVTKQLTTDAATTTTTETKKTGIDFKIVLVVLVAVFFLTKK
jgi:hypothetical protein